MSRRKRALSAALAVFSFFGLASSFAGGRGTDIGGRVVESGDGAGNGVVDKGTYGVTERSGFEDGNGSSDRDKTRGLS